ncbi:MAG: type I restriction enzyme HsdR N-terminal domain-containing protein [Bacteroidaceae bacterium]|nr:type I restriction enzyme HsdR N-terminal domain-containing protein [Bacteroidaceae bacterium]
MQVLNLLKTDLKIITKDGKQLVFDILRRKYVALTPEEWVRQQFVHYLIQHKGYPSECIGNEISISLNGTKKRCDSVVYGCNAQPIMIIEYKSPNVDITQHVFEQISRYNIKLKVKWLVVSNGLQHYCCKINYENGTYQFVEDIPAYEDIHTYAAL